MPRLRIVPAWSALMTLSTLSPRQLEVAELGIARLHESGVRDCSCQRHTDDKKPPTNPGYRQD